MMDRIPFQKNEEKQQFELNQLKVKSTSQGLSMLQNFVNFQLHINAHPILDDFLTMKLDCFAI